MRVIGIGLNQSGLDLSEFFLLALAAWSLTFMWGAGLRPLAAAGTLAVDWAGCCRVLSGGSVAWNGPADLVGSAAARVLCRFVLLPGSRSNFSRRTKHSCERGKGKGKVMELRMRVIGIGLNQSGLDLSEFFLLALAAWSLTFMWGAGLRPLAAAGTLAVDWAGCYSGISGLKWNGKYQFWEN